MAQTSGPRFVELAETRRRGEVSMPAGEPSLPAALEKLASATQGVITKRIDLFMLEINELVGKLVVRVALVGFGVVVALAAWFGAVASLVLYLTPHSGSVIHFALFALANAIVGAAVAAFAIRAQLPKLSAEKEEEIEQPQA